MELTTNTAARSTTSRTLAALKAAGDDFEWYPTTDAMLYAVARHCSEVHSLLDIGAGDGRALLKINAYRKAIEHRPDDGRGEYNRPDMKLYAIEKALTHIDAMPAGVSIVGTDFFLQSLIDKDVDAIFCNPPYSQYEEFAVKIIKEAHCHNAFLVLPDRWNTSPAIKAAIESRKADVDTIWKGDFLNAERKARAFVDVVKITYRVEGCWNRKDKPDPFDSWFSEMFPEFDKVKPNQSDDEGPAKRSGRFSEIVPGQNLIERLAELYRDEMTALFTNYRALCSIDAALLKELGVNHDDIKKGLKLKIAGTKNVYWKELFEHLDKITSRLTKASREEMFKKLRGCNSIDYTADNAYAVVLWVVKNANQYFNDQLCDMFKKLSEPECVKNYKSNQRTWQRDKWRYNDKDKHTHYMLDYRIVTTRHHAIYNGDGYGKYDYPGGLHNESHEFISDIMTIANNLGFTCPAETNDSRVRAWISGGEQRFYMTIAGKTRELMAVRAFKNGNIHIKFDQVFIKTLNIEASRLLGWIRTPQEAAEEMGGVSVAFAREVFGRANKQFLPSESRALLTA